MVLSTELILTVSNWASSGSLKEVILNSFYFGRVWWFLKKLIFNTFYFG